MSRILRANFDGTMRAGQVHRTVLLAASTDRQSLFVIETINT